MLYRRFFMIASAAALAIMAVVWLSYFLIHRPSNVLVPASTDQTNPELDQAVAVQNIKQAYLASLAQLQSDLTVYVNKNLEPQDENGLVYLRDRLLSLHVPLAAQDYHLKLTLALDSLISQLSVSDPVAAQVKKSQNQLHSLLAHAPSLP